MSGPHLTVRLSSAWEHHGPGVELTGFIPVRDADSELKGRASFSATQGVFGVSMQPTEPELRRIAALCIALADHMACATAQAQARAQEDAEQAALATHRLQTEGVM